MKLLYTVIIIVSFLVTSVCTKPLIGYLKSKQFGQYIREEGPKAHKVKQGTPTMGGLAIIVGIIISTLVSFFITKMVSGKLLAFILSIILFGLIGFVDDYNKIAKKQNEGLTPKQKILLQILFGVGLGVYIMYKENSIMMLPFAKQYVDLGIFYIPFVAFIMVAMSNAVNLTDGLDGLASVNSAIVSLVFVIIGIKVAGEHSTMAIAGSAILGATLGFLLYNRYPAKVFMGDTGSMALGGGLSAVAIIGHMELLLPIAGLIFVIEASSVIIQVAYFKKTGGKRIFRMAPIHHHFELGGWSEVKVVTIFGIFTAVCCMIAYFSVA